MGLQPLPIQTRSFCMPHNLRSKSLDTSHLFSIQEVADYLKVCPNTVRALLKKGKLDAVKVGSQWRVGKASIENYLNGSTTNHQQWKTELYRSMEKLGIGVEGAVDAAGSELAQRLQELCSIPKHASSDHGIDGDDGDTAQDATQDSPQKRAAQTYFSPKVAPVIIPNVSPKDGGVRLQEPLSTDDLFD